MCCHAHRPDTSSDSNSSCSGASALMAAIAAPPTRAAPLSLTQTERLPRFQCLRQRRPGSASAQPSESREGRASCIGRHVQDSLVVACVSATTRCVAPAETPVDSCGCIMNPVRRAVAQTCHQPCPVSEDPRRVTRSLECSVGHATTEPPVGDGRASATVSVAARAPPQASAQGERRHPTGFAIHGAPSHARRWERQRAIAS